MIVFIHILLLLPIAYLLHQDMIVPEFAISFLQDLKAGLLRPFADLLLRRVVMIDDFVRPFAINNR